MAAAPVGFDLQTEFKVPLSTLIEFACQKAYHELTVLSELLPRKSDVERKTAIFNYAMRTRQLFIRILALLKWSANTSRIDKCAKMTHFLHTQSMMYINTADILYHMSKATFVQACLPVFSVAHAAAILTTGKYSYLPECIETQIVHRDPIQPDDRADALDYLNRTIKSSLMYLEIPIHCVRHLKVKNGILTLAAQDEFSCYLTLLNDGHWNKWLVLDLEFTLFDPTHPTASLVHPVQLRYLRDILQKRLLTPVPPKPFTLVYEFLHSFALSLQIELLESQARHLKRINLTKSIAVERQANGKSFSLTYWQSEVSPWNSQSETFSIAFSMTPEKYQISLVHKPITLKGSTRLSGSELNVQNLLVKCYRFHAKRWLGLLSEKLRESISKSTIAEISIKEALSSRLPMLFVLLFPSVPSSRIIFYIDSVTTALCVKATAENRKIEEVLFTGFTRGDFVSSLQTARKYFMLEHFRCRCESLGYHVVSSIHSSRSGIVNSPFAFYIRMNLSTVKCFLKINVEKINDVEFSFITLEHNEKIINKVIDKSHFVQPSQSNVALANEDTDQLLIFAFKMSYAWQVVIQLKSRGFENVALQFDGIQPVVLINDFQSLYSMLPHQRYIDILEEKVLSCRISIMERVNSDRWSVTLILTDPQYGDERTQTVCEESSTNLSDHLYTSIQSVLFRIVMLYDLAEQFYAVQPQFPHYKMKAFDFKELTFMYGRNEEYVCTIISHIMANYFSFFAKFGVVSTSRRGSEAASLLPLHNPHQLLRFELSELLLARRDMRAFISHLERTSALLRCLSSLPNRMILDRQPPNLPASQLFSLSAISLEKILLNYKRDRCISFTIKGNGSDITITDENLSHREQYLKINQLAEFVSSFMAASATLSSDVPITPTTPLVHQSSSQYQSTLMSPGTPGGGVSLNDILQQNAQSSPQAAGVAHHGTVSSTSSQPYRSSSTFPNGNRGFQQAIGHTIDTVISCIESMTHESVPLSSESLHSAPSYSCSPLEMFLHAARIYHEMSMQMQMMLQHRGQGLQLQLQLQPQPIMSDHDALTWRSAAIEIGFKLSPSSISPGLQLSLASPPHATQQPWSPEDWVLIDRFYKSFVAAPPFGYSQYESFLRILSLDVHIVKDWIQLIRLVFPNPEHAGMFRWRLELPMLMPFNSPMPQLISGGPSIWIKENKLLFVIKLSPNAMYKSDGAPPIPPNSFISIPISFVFDMRINNLTLASSSNNGGGLGLDVRLLDKLKQFLLKNPNGQNLMSRVISDIMRHLC